MNHLHNLHEHFDAFALHQIKQLFRGTSRLLYAALPFLHGGGTDVQDGGKRGLAEMIFFAYRNDFLRRIVMNIRNAERFNVFHGDLVNDPAFVKIGNCFSDGFCK